MRPNLVGLHLKRDQGHCPIEQADDIEEAARDVLRDEHRTVLVLRIALPLDVPVLDSSNDMGLIGGTELKLDFIPPFAVEVLEKQIKAACPG